MRRYNNMNTKYPGVAQLVARLLWEQDAAGSNPVTRTMKKPHQKAIFRTSGAVFCCCFERIFALFFRKNQKNASQNTSQKMARSEVDYTLKNRH